MRPSPRFEATWHTQLVVLMEYVRSAGSEAAPRLREAFLRYREAFAEALQLDPGQAGIVDFTLSGLMVQRLLDGGTTPLEPTRDALVQLLCPEEAP